MASHGNRCPDCGDSTSLSIYENGTYCHHPQCHTSTLVDGASIPESTPKKVTRLEMTGQIEALPDRRISRKTCEKYNIHVHEGKHYYPYYNVKTREATATKIRLAGVKKFPWTGDRTDIGLFGQQTCKGHGKFITVTEGELDCAAVDEMFDNRWDVVSLRDGAGNAHDVLAEQLQFLEGYDNIVLCFDNDEEGKKAVQKCQDLFSPNKLKIVELPEGYKDAGDMLKAKKVKEFTKVWWDAKTYLPVGIVKPSETLQAVKIYRDTPSMPYPWGGLNDLLIGQRTKELVIWAAETGVGKSQTMREIVHHIIQSCQTMVGCLMLEESIAKSMLGWMSFHAGRPLHKELDKLSDEELAKWHAKASEGDKFVLLDHRGWQSSIETLKARVRYMAKALGCKVIVLDHLHIALSSVAGATGDWSGIDELVTELTVLAQECDICLHLVSHVSEGRALRGSKGIGKLADAIIFLERDKHHPDPEVANTTAVIVDKNRFSGDIGPACYLRYDKQTGRMTECPKPDNLTAPEEF